MRITDFEGSEKLRVGLIAAASAPQKPSAASKKTSSKADSAQKTAKPAPAGQNKVVKQATGPGLPKGKPPISPNHQKLHAMARTHGFKHVGMSVYQHPTAGLTLSVGPSGWSLSDGSQGTDWEDLQAHLEKSFGLPMQDPNAIDPMTGQPMGQQTQPQQPGARRSQPGQGGMPQPGQNSRQKNPNSFQQGFMGT